MWSFQKKILRYNQTIYGEFYEIVPKHTMFLDNYENITQSYI